MQARQLGSQGDAQLRVEIRERLVHEERRRLTHHGPSHGDALALSTGEKARAPLHERLEAQGRRYPADAIRALLPGNAAELEAEPEVVLDGHLRVERVVLEHHRDVAVAEDAGL